MLWVFYIWILQAFQPMATCAKQVIQDNGMSNKIHLISKRSTDVTVGPGIHSVKYNRISIIQLCIESKVVFR